jgi:hypothetical protein
MQHPAVIVAAGMTYALHTAAVAAAAAAAAAAAVGHQGRVAAPAVQRECSNPPS